MAKVTPATFHDVEAGILFTKAAPVALELRVLLLKSIRGMPVLARAVRGILHWRSQCVGLRFSSPRMAFGYRRHLALRQEEMSLCVGSGSGSHSSKKDIEAEIGSAKYEINSHRQKTCTIDRGRLTNDILQTSVMAALIGGFALSNLQMDFFQDANNDDKADTELLDSAIYLSSVIAVHACTCSCLTSAFLYRTANGLADAELAQWAENNKLLLQVPMIKFGMGCVVYLCSVICLGYRDLDTVPIFQTMSLLIGVMSVAMVFATVTYIQITSPKPNFDMESD